MHTCCLRTQQDPDALYVHFVFVRLRLICGDNFRCVKLFTRHACWSKLHRFLKQEKWMLFVRVHVVAAEDDGS